MFCDLIEVRNFQKMILRFKMNKQIAMMFCDFVDEVSANILKKICTI